MSAGRTIPFFMISAYPEIDVRGVFSSWETFAENSLRILETASFSLFCLVHCHEKRSQLLINGIVQRMFQIQFIDRA